jgi:uncharacterized LabA/DUF88 family protein
MKIAIFVDGSNLIGSLMKTQIRLDDYQSFYAHIVEESGKILKHSVFDGKIDYHILQRVYWYQVGTMDTLHFDDLKFKNNFQKSFNDNTDVKRAYLAITGKENPSLSGKPLHEAAFELCFNEAQEWYEQKRTSLEKMNTFNYSVRSNTDFIDIIECGHWKVDSLRKKIDEKGIDTSLVIDMVTQINYYDVAILISGDADMIPSINFAKNHGKQVGVVDIIPGYPPDAKGKQSSTRLKNAADFVVQIYEMNLVSKGIAKK